MEIEFKEGPSNTNPWGLSQEVTLEDMVNWVKVGEKAFKCLPDTKTRIKAGENPEVVLMDALEFWRPGMHRCFNILNHTIEIGHGDPDPKSLWRDMAKGVSPQTLGKSLAWVYIDNEPPLRMKDSDLQTFLCDLEFVKTEEDLKILKKIWK